MESMTSTEKKISVIEAVQRDNGKKRVAAYCRVSTSSEEQLSSLESQKTYFETYIQSNPSWEFAGVYYDEGLTGTHMEKRNGIKELLYDGEQGKIDIILVKSISRFARNTVDCLNLVRRFKELGIGLHFQKESINTEEMNGELLLTILSGMAQNESTSISLNQKWADEKRIKNGTKKIISAPYGYRIEKGNQVVYEPEAEVVKFIFSEYLSGNGSSLIAQKLNEKGIKSLKGLAWREGAINGIIKNVGYTGDYLYQKTYSDSAFRRHINNGEVAQYLIENHHEAIISKETYNKAKRLQDYLRQDYGNCVGNEKSQSRYTLSGKVLCGECGGTCIRKIRKNAASEVIAFVCNNHVNDKASCSLSYIHEDAINSAFMTMMNKLIFSKNVLLKPLHKKMSTKGASDSTVENLSTKRLEELKSEKHKVTTLYERDYIEPAVYQEKIATINKEISEVEANRDLFLLISNEDRKRFQEIDKLTKFVNTHEIFTEYDPSLMDEFLSQVKLFDDGTAQFVLNCGLTLKEVL